MKERVASLVANDSEALTPVINEFLEMTDGKLIDIKFSTFADDDPVHFLRVLVIYEPAASDKYCAPAMSYRD